MKISKKLIIAILIFTAVLGPALSYAKLYSFHLVLLGLFLFYFLKNKKITIRKEFDEFLFIIYFFLAFISFIWSAEISYTFRYFFYLINGITLIFIIKRNINDIRDFSYFFNFVKYPILIQIIIALLESFTSFRLPTSPYSKYASFFGKKASDIEGFNVESQLYLLSSPTGFMGNPNNLAVILVTIIPFFWFSRNVYVKVLGTFSIFLIIVMTGSRGAFLAFLFGLFVFIFMKSKKIFFTMMIILIFSISFIDFFIEKLKESEVDKLVEIATVGEALNQYLFEESNSSGSISIRQTLIRNGLEALVDSNGLGVGAGASNAIQEKKGVFKDVTSMHNFWIELLVEMGIFFFVLFVTWYLYTLFRLYFIFKKSNDALIKFFAGSFFCSLTVFIVSNISASTVIYMLPIWLLYGFSLALIKINNIHENNYYHRS